ncbi:hypothetical protein O4220_22240 [Rhodococcus ruber]|uniref:DUF7683 domain-containing protein n=1 Tax=Rhodococcus ruber TaxID=1830 RepID=A0ABT4MJS3_9NOCA|nr:hypothetical protein [Rhodococcus ruber]MCZ4521243.1 hypothetical protein [Rhodococcus ruber]
MAERLRSREDEDLPNRSHQEPRDGMWYLESYNDRTDLIADSYLLTAITGDEIRELIDVDESELPLEMGPYPVALADVPKFAKYIEGDFKVSSDNEYFIGLFTD